MTFVSPINNCNRICRFSSVFLVDSERNRPISMTISYKIIKRMNSNNCKNAPKYTALEVLFH